MASIGASGIAKAGLTTGIIGTALSSLLALKDIGSGGAGLLGGGLLGGGAAPNINLTGGLGGGNIGGVIAGQAAYQAALSAKDAEIGQLKAERYADQIGSSVFDRAIQMSNRNDEKINANLKEAFGELVVTRERLATADANFKCLADSVNRIGNNVNDLNKEIADMRVREQRTADAIDCLAKSTSMRFDSVYKDIDCVKREFGAAIALESERRVNGDQNLMCYVNATFVPGKLVMPKEAICPEVMQRWNSWVAPTGEAPATQPVSGSINATVTSRSK